MLPLVIGTDRQFSRLRKALDGAGFTESAVCERSGIESIYQFKTMLEQQSDRASFGDRLDVLIRLLMDGLIIKEKVILEHLSSETLGDLEALGLVERDPENSALCNATAFLYPVAGVYIASDRTFAPRRKDQALPEDVVYAAITANTGRFLSILPQEPCDDFLDLCSGTGVAAIAAGAHYAQHSWATDLGARCVHFAEFNRLLNGLTNVNCAQGDLYDAVGDRTFDRIAAHPPYVPSKDRKFLFRDGGEDGEQILRRIIEGLPSHLRPNGRFYCVTFATDREDSQVEKRVRDWLGEAQSEFDICLLESEFQSRPEALLNSVEKAKGRLGTLSETARLFEELKVTGLFYGTIVVHRKTESRPAATGRIRKAVNAGTGAVEWFWRWQAASHHSGFSERVLESRPAPSAGFKLQVTHTRQQQGMIPSHFLLRTESPFMSEAVVEPWVAVVVGNCDGQRTVRQIFSEMKRQEVISAEMTEADFEGIVQLLISNGFLEVPGWPLPVPFTHRSEQPAEKETDGLGWDLVQVK
ncbi:MAG: methyltransferase [Acidobacteriota bacterium]|nr:methyltransferase [Acidobacteriota bacterium]